MAVTPTALSSTSADHGVAGRASDISDRVRARWAGMAGRLGLGFTFLGFIVIALAWSGAAGLDYSQGQMPYVISGGFGGLGLIVTGAALTIAESNRRDRALLAEQLTLMTATLSKLQTGGPGSASEGATPFAFAGPDDVVVGRSSYHRPDCRLIAGRGEAELMHRDDAVADRTLSACRVCKP